MNNSTINAAANKAKEVLNDVMDIMGFSLLRNQLEEVVAGDSAKEIAANIQRLAERRRIIYAHVANEGGYAEAIQLIRAEGIIPGAAAVGAATAGAAVRGAKYAISLTDALFEHKEDEGKVVGLIRSFYFGVRNVAKTIIEKGIEVAKMLLKALWEIVKKIVSFLINSIKKLINKAKAHKLGDSLVGGFDDIEDDDFDDIDDLDDVDDVDACTVGVNEVYDGFQRFSNCEVVG